MADRVLLASKLTDEQRAAIARTWREIVGAPPEHWAAAPLASAMEKIADSGPTHVSGSDDPAANMVRRNVSGVRSTMITSETSTSNLSIEIRLEVIRNEIRHLAETVGVRIGANGVEARNAAAFDAWQEALGKVRELNESITRAVETERAKDDE